MRKIHYPPGRVAVVLTGLWAASVASCSAPSQDDHSDWGEAVDAKKNQLDYLAQCEAKPAEPLCTLSATERVAPTLYPVMLIPGSGGGNGTLANWVQGTGAQCGACKGFVEPKVHEKYQVAFLYHCSFPIRNDQDLALEFSPEQDRYAICCGNGGEQHVYIPRLQGFQPSAKRLECLAVHLMRARDLFGPDQLGTSANDTNHDGFADQINLIGHSMGGVDAALMSTANRPYLSEFDDIGLPSQADDIASVTALAAPLQGAGSATTVLDALQAIPGFPKINRQAPLESAQSRDWRGRFQEWLARIFARMSSPEYVSNSETSVVGWLQQMEQPNFDVLHPDRLHPRVFYQTLASFALPSPDFYTSALSTLLLRGTHCGPVSAQSPGAVSNNSGTNSGTNSGQGAGGTTTAPPMSRRTRLMRAFMSQDSPETQRLWFTRTLLEQVDAVTRGHYAFAYPGGKRLSDFDIRRDASSWLRRLPVLSPVADALWVFGFLGEDAQGRSIIVPGDRIVPLFSSATGTPTTFHLGDIDALKKAKLQRGMWWFRGAVPTDHDGIGGGEISLSGTVWENGTPRPNPCTGFDSVCMLRTILKELQALGY
jgi:hypothetical protein